KRNIQQAAIPPRHHLWRYSVMCQSECTVATVIARNSAESSSILIGTHMANAIPATMGRAERTMGARESARQGPDRSILLDISVPLKLRPCEGGSILSLNARGHVDRSMRSVEFHFIIP